MLKMLSALSLLASLGCASARIFSPMDNCVSSLVEDNVFVCVDAAGKPYSILWMNSHDLVCFRADQFKTFNETCHK